MRGRPSEQFKPSGPSPCGESPDQIPPAVRPLFPNLLVEIRMETGHGMQFWQQHRALTFRARQLAAFREVTFGSRAQERVRPHRDQGGSDTQGEFPIHPILIPSAHPPQQRQIAFRHRLIEPIFLQKAVMLRMTHPRKVGVQDNGQGSDHRCAQGIASSGGSPGVPGCEPTPPWTTVCRARVRVAWRTSEPRGATATSGNSKRPSGNAQRKVKEPSGRSAIGRPDNVT